MKKQNLFGWKRKKEEYRNEMEKRWKETNNNLTGISRWDRLITTVKEVAEAIGMVRKRKTNQIKKDNLGIEGKEQKKKVWKALKEYLKSKGKEAKETLKEEKKKLRNMRIKKKTEENEKKWGKVEKSKNSKDFWEAIGKFRPKKKQRGKEITKEQWVEHFKKLLLAEDKRTKQTEEVEGEMAENEDLEELNKDIEENEVQKVLKKMKNKKAAGEDGVVVEFLKNMPDIWIRELSKSLNQLRDKGEIIEGWEEARIYPIYKTGEENLTKNYRGVALLDSGYKLLTNIMAGRLQKWLERKEIIRESSWI